VCLFIQPRAKEDWYKNYTLRELVGHSASCIYSHKIQTHTPFLLQLASDNFIFACVNTYIYPMAVFGSTFVETSNIQILIFTSWFHVQTKHNVSIKSVTHTSQNISHHSQCNVFWLNSTICSQFP